MKSTTINELQIILLTLSGYILTKYLWYRWSADEILQEDMKAIMWWFFICRLIVWLRLIFLAAVIGKWLILIKTTKNKHLIVSFHLKTESHQTL